MLYAIYAEDSKNSLSKRTEVRPEHVERLQELKQQGKLILAGPLPAIDNIEPGPAGFTGSLIVAEFPSLKDAQHWANDDPYIKAGVYQNITVKPFNKTFP